MHQDHYAHAEKVKSGYKKCKVPDCTNNAHRSANGRRGWCSAHYKRWISFGDLKTEVPVKQYAREGEAMNWLLTVALPHEKDECLKWPFSRDGRGYARVWHRQKTDVASRVVCEKIYGPPPSQLHEAAHSCGKGHLGCVNPKHLRWATVVENCQDKELHGTLARGERIGRSKLSEKDVREIRKQFRCGALPRQLSDRFKVTPCTIGKVVNRKSWAWLD